MRPWIQDWVDALESGYFKQIPNDKDQWDPDGRYSALGVLCDINGYKKQTLKINLDRVRVIYDDLVDNKGYTETIEQLIQRSMKGRTVHWYGERRGAECLSYIPIDLTSKLRCNASLDLLSNAIRYEYQINIRLPNHGIIQEVHPNIASLESAGVPFAVIAEFIRDVWPGLTFESKFTPKPKDYGYFTLERC